MEEQNEKTLYEIDVKYFKRKTFPNIWISPKVFKRSKIDISELRGIPAPFPFRLYKQHNLGGVVGYFEQIPHREFDNKNGKWIEKNNKMPGRCDRFRDKELQIKQ